MENDFFKELKSKSADDNRLIFPVLDSKMIKSIEYNTTTNQMLIMFATGNEYVYDKVEQSLFDAFCAAESKGKFYNQYVKGKFKFSDDEDDEGYKKFIRDVPVSC